MILAERKIYQDYYQQKNNDEVNSAKRRKTRNKLRAISKLCIVFVIAVIITSRFAVISEYSYKINKMETEFAELQKVNERLNLQLAQLQDITWIEEYAGDRLGMIYPENTDIIYVAVDRIPEKVVQESSDQKYGIKGWVAALAGKMSSFISEN